MIDGNASILLKKIEYFFSLIFSIFGINQFFFAKANEMRRRKEKLAFASLSSLVSKDHHHDEEDGNDDG